MKRMSFPDTIDFPKMEEEILQRWKEQDTFQESMCRNQGCPEYTFYDGPPFATGLPHYGHILAGTIKDTVTRYAHQTGHHVVRRFGWDCHGLPIEFEIDKELNIRTRDQVLELGVDQYNEKCRGIVMRYSKEWESTVLRMGRWIDFKNDYKTMDPSFMESVWWVFQTLWNRGLIYQGFKVMPYSKACGTPLSNFEASMDYRNVNDLEAIISFRVTFDNQQAYLLAWTTTPWTLPSNLALIVHPTMEYVRLFYMTNQYVVAKSRLDFVFPSKEYQIIGEPFAGKQLEGLQYKPLFPTNGDFRVLVDSYVTDDTGTGIIHAAPAFGEDDYRVCHAAGIIPKDPLDCNGRFTSEIPALAGQDCHEASKEVLRLIRPSVFRQGTINHSYPFCWRSGTPLIYRAVPSWFVRVEQLRDQLLKHNATTHWVPEFVKEKRFHNWLAQARDWSISRNRFWGTPIPLWVNPDDPSDIVCIGSVEELRQYSQLVIHDLHSHMVNNITIPSTKHPGAKLHRVPEVFDCWFESGSMPYAQVHYPFEQTEVKPADFIAEGIDQTRGWFYTLLVLSTALFNRPPFQNLICNGMVLASDGKKMSKSLRNYPDPMTVVQSYGADALRLYLINSPVVRGDSLRFREDGVREILKNVMIPWFNAVRFFLQSNKSLVCDGAKPRNLMDRWILAELHNLLTFVQAEMAAYRLYTVVPKLLWFLEQLTNWYIRLNRSRIKGSAGRDDRAAVLITLMEVLLTMTRAMAPFTPFCSEYLYLHLTQRSKDWPSSVHFIRYPTPQPSWMDPMIVSAVQQMQTVVEQVRYLRNQVNIPLKFPLPEVTVILNDPTSMVPLIPYLMEECNVREVRLLKQADQFMHLTATLDKQRCGKRLRRDLNKVANAVEQLNPDILQRVKAGDTITVEGYELELADIVMTQAFHATDSALRASWTGDLLVVLNTQQTKELYSEGLAREVGNRLQRLRKSAGLHANDPVDHYIETTSSVLDDTIETHRAMLEQKVQAPILKLDDLYDRPVITEGHFNIHGMILSIVLVSKTVL